MQNSRTFHPDYRYIVEAARNRPSDRMPLYEHSINMDFIEKALGKQLCALFTEGESGLREYFRVYCEYHLRYGYDTVSFENCITNHVQQGQALMGHAPSLFTNLEDIRKYDWDGLVQTCIEDFDLSYRILSETMPDGMKAVGGLGNGVFEIAQDFVPFTELVYLSIDDPEGYSMLFRKIGDVMYRLWEWFLPRYRDSYVVCRFGDDLGFKSSTLLQPQDIRTHILPQYKRIVDLVHAYERPFLLHSCGAIFDVMDDLIDGCGIDAKHSNEDQIAPFSIWVDDYGDRIGNFGGVETNVLCLDDEKSVKEYVTAVCRYSADKGGAAIGSGNQISEYIPVQNFIAMTEAVRDFRSEGCKN
jgi:uroporphyrinogen decarboxylase